MAKNASRSRWLPYSYRFLIILLVTACGTFEVAMEEPTASPPASPGPPAGSTAPPQSEPAATPVHIEAAGEADHIQAIAWYGTIHSVPGAERGNDYLKMWHLDIWPKFGRAVGVAGSDPATGAEIERLRDTDTKARFWGRLTCGVGDYGACQFLVTRVSADDGGPSYGPEPVEGWEGTIGRLPAQPGSQNDMLYFVLAGEVPVLYGIAGAKPAVQEALVRLPEGGNMVRIWGSLSSGGQPVTGTLIEVERLELVGPS